MNPKRVLLAGILITGLAGCGSSETVEDRYYSLVLAAGPADAAASEDAPDLIVGPIELPRYLGGRGLSMQVGSNRIETANHHFWAEPLDEAIGKVLARDIGERTDRFNVERESGRWSGSDDCRVRIEFDAFHPTHRAEVVVSGRYWVTAGDSSHRADFSLSRRLTMDGYANAVDELRRALQTLAGDIARSVDSADACATGEDAAPAEADSPAA